MRTIDSLFEEKWGRSKKQLGLFEEHLFFLEQMRFFWKLRKLLRKSEENYGKWRSLWGTPEKIMRKNVESYEEGNEDERGNMRKVIRKREDSYDEDKDIVRC